MKCDQETIDYHLADIPRKIAGIKERVWEYPFINVPVIIYDYQMQLKWWQKIDANDGVVPNEPEDDGYELNNDCIPF